MSDNYCVIMAGGIGSRFWPMSKAAKPKQFLDILGVGRTFIQQTFDRFNKIIPTENFYVVTSIDYKHLVLEQLPELKEEQVLAEPLRRNTAPCIAYASYKIKTINKLANIVVAPSDHLILDEPEFLKQIENGLEFVNENPVLLTLGIPPNRPETRYGYIQTDYVVEGFGADNLMKVKTFTEKPDLKMAELFVSSGEFYWNSGIFIWSLKAILTAFEQYMEDMSHLFKKGKKLYGTADEVHFLNKAYSECQNISIDYAIMEKAENVYVLVADFGWSDLGTWRALYESKEKDNDGNAIIGENVMTFGAQNCIVNVPNDKLVVLQGLEGFVVAESEGTLMVCRLENEQQIRQFVNSVRVNKGEEFV